MKSERTHRILQATGGFLWCFGYAVMIVFAVLAKVSPWPLAHGAWCWAWEIFFAYTDMKRISYKLEPERFVASAVVYIAWFVLDFCLTTIAIVYGYRVEDMPTMNVMDELNILPLDTAQERLWAVVSYTAVFLVMNIIVSSRNDNARRYVKYHSFAMMISIAIAMSRLPAWSSIGTHHYDWILYCSAFFIAASHIMYWYSKLGISIAKPEAITKLWVYLLAMAIPFIGLYHNFFIRLSPDSARLVYVMFYFVTGFPALLVEE